MKKVPNAFVIHGVSGRGMFRTESKMEVGEVIVVPGSSGDLVEV